MVERTQRVTTIYDQEYFAANQCNLYIGDVLIDEVTALSVKVTQNKRPVYGYASKRYDNVSRGTVIVEGQFQINFKESGYLYSVLNRHRQLNKPFVSPFISRDDANIMDFSRGGASRNGQVGFLTRQNIESILEDELNGVRLTPEQRIEYWQELSGYVSQAGALGKAEKLFENFENAIWGSDGTTDKLRRVDEMALNDFTVFITFGDFNRNDAVNHTARRIDNVQLTGQAQEIILNGQPVAEMYSFFARDFV